MKTKLTIFALLLTFAAFGQSGTVINGLEWANTNLAQPGVFAPQADMYTEFYQWNGVVGFSAADPLTPASEWESNEMGNMDPWHEDNWATNPCPTGWRLPTYDEILALQGLGYSWASAGARGNAVPGAFYGVNHATATMSDMQGCIFLPASGVRLDNGITDGTPGTYGYHGVLNYQSYYGAYWSSTYVTYSDGRFLSFFDPVHYYNPILQRPYFPFMSGNHSGTGMNIRPVRATPGYVFVYATSVSLNLSAISLAVGGTPEQLTATITPSNATNKTVAWSSNNKSVATVSSTGLVTAVAAGVATITVATAPTATSGSKFATCIVTVTAEARNSTIINGVEWSNTNLTQPGTFAERADTYTEFYQWGKNEGWSPTGSVTGWSATASTATEWTATPCPARWRLPTQVELQDLTTMSVWAYAYERGNEVDGIFYGDNYETCSLPDDMEGCIFFPASGARRNNTNGALTGQSMNGYYWSSEQLSATIGHGLLFNEMFATPVSTSKAFGYNIRCVYDVPAVTQSSYNYNVAQASYAPQMLTMDEEPNTMSQSASSAKLYPNPVTNGELTIDNGQQEIGVVEVLSRYGTLVRRHNFGSQTVATLPLQGLQGMYFVRVGKTAQSVLVVR